MNNELELISYPNSEITRDGERTECLVAIITRDAVEFYHKTSYSNWNQEGFLKVKYDRIDINEAKYECELYRNQSFRWMKRNQELAFGFVFDK